MCNLKYVENEKYKMKLDEIVIWTIRKKETEEDDYDDYCNDMLYRGWNISVLCCTYNVMQLKRKTI